MTTRLRTRTQHATAEQLLSSLWLPTRGQRPLPVDPIWIASQLGVQVYITQDLGPDVAGAVIKRPRTDPVILASPLDRPNRRLVVAHELGHYLLRELSDDEAFRYIDQRSPAQASDPAEIDANSFAASLLMPERLLKPYRQLGAPAAAANFGVPSEAMSTRFADLHW